MQTESKTCVKHLIIANSKDITYPQKRPKQKVSSKEFIKISSGIKHNGIMEPIVVKLNENSELEIINGEVRFDAALLAGLEDVPCILMECDEKYGEAFSIAEELKKGNLDIFEEADRIDTLVNKNNISKREVANILGKTLNEINAILDLKKFGEEEKCLIKEENVSDAHVYIISAINDFIYRRKALDEMIRKKLSIDQTNSLVKKYLKQINKYREREIKKYSMPEELRVFMSGLKKALDSSKSLGLNAKVSKMETEEYIECVVHISKIKGKKNRIAQTISIENGSAAIKFNISYSDI